MTVKELRDMLFDSNIKDESEILVSDNDKAYGEGNKIEGMYQLKESGALVIVGIATI